MGNTQGNDLSDFIQERDKEITTLIQVLANRDHEIGILKQELLSLTQSLSWRITHPLRVLNYQLRRLIKRTGAFDRRDYREWVRRYDTLDRDKRQMIINRIHLLSFKPKITLIIPIQDGAEEQLVKTLSSVSQQLYAHWELFVLGASANSTGLIDSRIHFGLEQEQQVILQASGDFVGWLTPGDALPAHALFWVAETMVSHPQVALIYSDEDALDVAGNRCNPYFKPAWNPDLILTHHYTAHFSVYRLQRVQDLLRAFGEWSSGYDLLLRFVEGLDSGCIQHIPRILYHRHTVKQSQAQDILALNACLAQRGILAQTSQTPVGFRVHYDLPASPPKVSLIIPTRDALYLIKRCIASILTKTDYADYEVIIVDNHSVMPETLQYFQQVVADSRVRIIRDEQPFNYSALNNRAVRHAEGELVCLLNNDTEIISADWLHEMVSIALQPGVGVVGAKLLYPNGTVQHAGVILGLGDVVGHAFKGMHPEYHTRLSNVCTVSAVTGACLMVRKAFYEQINGLNETELKIAFNDIDFCLRLRALGLRTVWTPHAVLFHHESATRGRDSSPEKQAQYRLEANYMQSQWGTELTSDPAYNPNLTLLHEDFSLAWPPRMASL